MELREIERLFTASRNVLDCCAVKADKPTNCVEDLITILDVLRTAIQQYAEGGDGSVDGIDAFFDILGEHLSASDSDAPTKAATMTVKIMKTPNSSFLKNKNLAALARKPTRTISSFPRKRWGQKAHAESKRKTCG